LNFSISPNASLTGWLLPSRRFVHQGERRLFLFLNLNLHNQGVFTMTISCPQCSSTRIQTRNLGRKAGSAIGALAGAARGAALGSAGGPIGAIVGGAAGAVMAGLFGGAAVGSRLGSVVDNNLLNNYQCRDCDYTFCR
jgi:hypothetical protein